MIYVRQYGGGYECRSGRRSSFVSDRARAYGIQFRSLSSYHLPERRSPVATHASVLIGARASLRAGVQYYFMSGCRLYGQTGQRDGAARRPRYWRSSGAVVHETIRPNMSWKRETLATHNINTTLARLNMRLYKNPGDEKNEKMI